MKGLSLEIPIGLADVFVSTESNITAIVKRECGDAPGSETIACYTLIYRSQLERSCDLFKGSRVKASDKKVSAPNGTGSRIAA